MRDITLEDTIYILFTTRSFSTGAPTQLAGTPVVSAYVDAGLTQITAGVTLGVDHDGVTGLNRLTIVATAANGFANGTDVSMVITTGTVGGVSVVGEVVGEFTIGRSAAAVDLANVTDGLGAIKADTAATLIDTNALQTDWANGGRLDNILDSRMAEASINTTGGAVDNVTLVATTTTNTDMRGTDNAALASVCTEARLAELGAANLPADIDAILTDTGTSIPALIAALNDLSAAQVNTEVVDALSTDTYAEPTGAPAATADLATKIGYLYMALRNRIDVSATTKTFYDDAGTAEWTKTLSDDGTTYSEAEGV